MTKKQSIGLAGAGIILIAIPQLIDYLNKSVLICAGDYKQMGAWLGNIEIGLNLFSTTLLYQILTSTLSWAGVAALFFAYSSLRTYFNLKNRKIVDIGLVVLLLIGFVGYIVTSSINPSKRGDPEASVTQIISHLGSEVNRYYNRPDNNFSYKGYCESAVDRISLIDNFPLINPSFACNVAVREIACVDSAEAFKITVNQSKHFNPEGYYCVDSTGFSGRISELQVGMKCR